MTLSRICDDNVEAIIYSISSHPERVHMHPSVKGPVMGLRKLGRHFQLQDNTGLWITVHADTNLCYTHNQYAERSLFTAQEIDTVRREVREDEGKLQAQRVTAHFRSEAKRGFVDLSESPLFGGVKQQGLF